MTIEEWREELGWRRSFEWIHVKILDEILSDWEKDREELKKMRYQDMAAVEERHRGRDNERD